MLDNTIFNLVHVRKLFAIWTHYVLYTRPPVMAFIASLACSPRLHSVCQSIVALVISIDMSHDCWAGLSSQVILSKVLFVVITYS
jgi:hypothetical protein